MADGPTLLYVIGGLVVWLVLGLIGASIMSSKGRSEVAGFALAALMGPIGLLIALLLEPSKEHRIAETMRFFQMMTELSEGGRQAKSMQPKGNQDYPRRIWISRHDNPELAARWSNGSVSPISITTGMRVASTSRSAQTAGGGTYRYLSCGSVAPPPAGVGAAGRGGAPAAAIERLLAEVDPVAAYEEIGALADRLGTKRDIVLLGVGKSDKGIVDNHVPAVADWLESSLGIRIEELPDPRL